MKKLALFLLILLFCSFASAEFINEYTQITPISGRQKLAEIYSSPIVYWNGYQYSPIDSRIVDYNSDYYAVEKGVYKAYFSKLNPVTKIVKGDYWIEQTVPLVALTNKVNGSKITYIGLFGDGNDLEIEYMNSTLKTNIILNNKPAPFNYETVITYSPNLVFDKATRTFKNQTGQIIFTLQTPFAKDSRQYYFCGKQEKPVNNLFDQLVVWLSGCQVGRTGDYSELNTTITQEGNKIGVSTELTQDWLDKIVYPVTIDPTTTFSIIADAWILQTHPDTNFGSDSQLFACHGSIVCAENRRSVMKYYVSIPDFFSLTYYNLSIYAWQYAGWESGKTVISELANTGWGENAVTWNNLPGTSISSSANTPNFTAAGPSKWYDVQGNIPGGWTFTNNAYDALGWRCADYNGDLCAVTAESREGYHAPIIKIQYVSSNPPSAPTGAVNCSLSKTVTDGPVDSVCAAGGNYKSSLTVRFTIPSWAVGKTWFSVNNGGGRGATFACSFAVENDLNNCGGGSSDGNCLSPTSLTSTTGCSTPSSCGADTNCPIANYSIPAIMGSGEKIFETRVREHWDNGVDCSNIAYAPDHYTSFDLPVTILAQNEPPSAPITIRPGNTGGEIYNKSAITYLPVNWTASTDTSGDSIFYYVYYSNDNGGSWNYISLSIGTSMLWNIQNMTPGNQYKIRVYPYTEPCGGTEQRYGLPGTSFNTFAIGEVFSLSGVHAESITNESAVIIWTSSKGANTLVNYGLTPALGTPVINGSEVNTISHHVFLSSLSNLTTYYYNVTSCANDTGQCLTSGPNYFTTLANGSEPYIVATSTSPNPALVNQSVLYSLSWASGVPSDSIKGLVCSTASLTGATCTATTICNSSYSINNPATCSATAPPAPGIYTYYAYVCSISGACSSATYPISLTVIINPPSITQISPTTALKNSNTTYSLTVAQGTDPLTCLGWFWNDSSSTNYAIAASGIYNQAHNYSINGTYNATAKACDDQGGVCTNPLAQTGCARSFTNIIITAIPIGGSCTSNGNCDSGLCCSGYCTPNTYSCTLQPNCGASNYSWLCQSGYASNGRCTAPGQIGCFPPGAINGTYACNNQCYINACSGLCGNYTNTCMVPQPGYCNAYCQYLNNCGICGCPTNATYECLGDGTCKPVSEYKQTWGGGIDVMNAIKWLLILAAIFLFFFYAMKSIAKSAE